MLRSLREERSRHFTLALRIALPLLLFILVLVYAIFYGEESVSLSVENVVIFVAMTFVIVYYIYFAFEQSQKETLLDRVTEGYHFGAFLQKVARERPQTLAALQINNLSTINENFGVGEADRILRRLVQLLEREMISSLDSQGYVGRKTGAELLLALQAEPEAVREALERFVAQHPRIEEVETELVFAVIGNNLDDPEKALEQLRDEVVQQAWRKETGKERRQIPNALQLSMEEQRVIETLERGAITLSFRPLLNLHSGRRDLYEVGVKMEASDGVRIAPRDFLPIVNRHNLGQRYDLLIFKRLLSLAPLVDEEISFSFNLSPFSLRKEEFLQELFSELEASGLAGERFIIELYERRRHHLLEEYLESLARIRRHGLRLCLDNFGSSNASMEYLRHFPFDMIQFDRDYTRELEEEKNRSVLKSFVSMAGEMGMTTAAKWVDDSRKIEILKEIGVDYIQGYAAGHVLGESELLRTYNPIEKG